MTVTSPAEARPRARRGRGRARRSGGGGRRAPARASTTKRGSGTSASSPQLQLDRRGGRPAARGHRRPGHRRRGRGRAPRGRGRRAAGRRVHAHPRGRHRARAPRGARRRSRPPRSLAPSAVAPRAGLVNRFLREHSSRRAERLPRRPPPDGAAAGGGARARRRRRLAPVGRAGPRARAGGAGRRARAAPRRRGQRPRSRRPRAAFLPRGPGRRRACPARRKTSRHHPALAQEGPGHLREDARLRPRAVRLRGARAPHRLFASVKHVAEKKGDHWELKDEQGPSDPQAEQSRPPRRATTRSGRTGGVDANKSRDALYEDAQGGGHRGSLGHDQGRNSPRRCRSTPSARARRRATQTVDVRPHGVATPCPGAPMGT